jgi:hypothetical protein
LRGEPDGGEFFADFGLGPGFDAVELEDAAVRGAFRRAGADFEDLGGVR